MIPSRVVLYAIAPMLHDVLEGLLRDAPGVELVPGDARAASLVGAAQLSDADVVITGERSATAEDVCRLLEQRTRTRALSVAHGGRTATLFELRPHRRLIGDLSPEAVLGAVRPVAPCPQRLQPDRSPRQVP